MCCKALGVTEELQGVLLCLCIKVQTFDDMDQVLEISTTSVIWTLQKWTGSRHNREVSTFLWFSLYNSVIENSIDNIKLSTGTGFTVGLF